MPLSLEDRLEVQDALYRYTFAVDDFSGKTTEQDFWDVFTEDIVSASQTFGTQTGAEVVRRFIEQIHRRRKMQVSVRHYVTNCTVDGDGGEAKLRAYFIQTLSYFKPEPAGPRRVTEFLLSGSYDCTARKTNGIWKLANRTTHLEAPPAVAMEPKI